MLQSVRDQIVSNFVDALKGTDDAPAPCPVLRAPTQPLIRDDSIPGIVVTPLSETVVIEQSDHESQSRKLSLKVVCVFADIDTDDETIDQKVEPLTSWVESRILADETFGGLANESYVTGITWHIEAVDADYIGAEMTVEILYFTARNAPDVRD